MRFASLLPIVVCASLVGCEWLTKKAVETTIETTTGQKVDLDEGKITITTEDGKTVVEQDGERATLTTEKGALRIGKEVPADFPLPVYDGAKVLQSMNMKDEDKGRSYMLGLHVPKASPAELATFYESALKKVGFEVQRVETKMDDSTLIILSGKKDGTEATAQIAAQSGKEGVNVNLVWQGK